MGRRGWVVVFVAGLVVAACSSDDDESSEASSTSAAATSVATVAPTDAPTTSGAPTTSTPDTVPATEPSTTTSPPPDTTEPDTTEPTTPPCDPATVRSCLLPWPNDAFTVEDPTTPTGRRVAIPTDWTPLNAEGNPIDVTDQNRADGFSPGTAILIDAPGFDPVAAGLAPSTDIGSSLADGAPVTITDVETGERVPYWGELDAQAPDDLDRLLMIHPAVSLTEGHTYEVTFFFDHGDGGVEQSWTFTVASTESLSGRLLHIRDDAYESLGDLAPTFTVTESVDEGAIRTIEGTIDVPNYLTGEGLPGSTFALGDDGLPTRNEDAPSYPARFRCVLPVAPAAPVPVIVYGHGLLGSRGEVDALSFAAELGVAGACATDWIGMSSEDIPNVAAILGDLSSFNQQADRMQQGQLNFQFLGRALNDERAFASHSAFHSADGTPLIAVGETQFVGNSQGGILGGAASAISTEWDRAVLGVPGINYSILLHRSSDWPQFQAIFDEAYTDPISRNLALQLTQMLWDRGENNGYVQHLTSDPYPGIEPKDVMLIEAFGDHQVANVSTEILARTIDAFVYQPAIGAGRSNDVEPMWGIEPLDFATWPGGGVLFLWDFGTPAPPPVNLPPFSPDHGEDPHGAGSREQRVLTLALTFLASGSLADVCAGAPCVSDVLTG